MPLTPEPTDAGNIIEFDGTPGRASRLKYDVTMPASLRGRRLLKLDLGLDPTDILPSAAGLTSAVAALGWTKKADGTWSYDAARALEMWIDKTATAYHGSFAGDVALSDVVSAMAQKALTAARATPTQPLDLAIPLDVLPQFPSDVANTAYWGVVKMFLIQSTTMYSDFVQGLSMGRLVLPQRTWAGSVVTDSIDAESALSTSRDIVFFFLVEVYGISSFLGDYGLGRTIRTFTLLPGEETTITMKTWQTDTEKSASTTSIVDSYDEKSSARFNDTVQNETTDKKTRNDKLDWHAEAEVKGQWGFGEAKVSGGASGENQTGREEFSKAVTDAVKEHCAEASSNRSNTVSLTTESDVVVGTEATTTRTIRNINLRRVLNFVFRELNQEYETLVHLLEVKIGFSTSTPDSYREVPIAGLRPLLEEILVTGKVDDVAAQLVALAGTVMGGDGTPVRTLEKLTLAPDGTFTIGPAEPDPATGRWAPPPADASFVYRWKPGPLEQAADDPVHVDGIVMNRTSIVMRTPDVVVEALLGRADALDEFAMTSQFEEAEQKRLDNRRTTLALDTLQAIPDPAARAEAWAKVFPPPVRHRDA